MRFDARFPAAFFAIYVIWGSTYLAIRVAVETIPPLAAAGLRHLFAGAILFFWARALQPRITAPEWRASLVVAALFFLIGHGTLHWAEQIVASGMRPMFTDHADRTVFERLARSRARNSSGEVRTYGP